MPISWLDVILIVIMLISGFLAMVRGFTREVLSIFSWAVAAVAALYLTPKYSAVLETLHRQPERRPDRLRRRRFHHHPDRREPDHLPHLRQGARQPGRRARPHLGLHLRAGARLPAGRHRLHPVHRARPRPTGLGRAMPGPIPILQQTQVAIESLLPMNPEQYLPGTKPEGEQPGHTARRPTAETPAEGAPAGPIRIVR